MWAMGVDGGGTRTRCVCIDANGRWAGMALAGGGNYQEVGLEGVAGLMGGFRTALGIEPGAEVALCLALAGAGRQDEQAVIAAWARDSGQAVRVRVMSDAEGALEGAHGGAPGIIAIAGTGSIVLGRAAELRVRAGGWGPVLGDEGSGYAIGLSALRAVLRHFDGWGRPTVLGEALQKALGIEAWPQLVAAVYSDRRIGREEIAALAPAVLAAAAAGDAVAAEILEQAGRDLGGQVAGVAGRLGMRDGAPFAGCGGLFEAGEALRPGLESATASLGIRLIWRRPLLPAVLGAALVARRLVVAEEKLEKALEWGERLEAEEAVDRA